MTLIECHQLEPRIGERALNQAAALAAISQSVARQADIVVLPELTTSGYMFDSPAEARSLALRPDALELAEWAQAAGESLVIGGFPELGDDGLVYNSAAIVDGSGVLAVYRKIHLWDREKLVFEPGAAAPPILETRHGRVAVVICYDLEFPELTRAIALAGADLIAAPTNWPLGPRPEAERPAEVGICMATARMNHVAVACCDRTGIERGQEWTGGTSIIDENGWVVSAAGASGLATAELDLFAARDKTMTELADAFADRRPEVYAGLAAEYAIRARQQATTPVRAQA